MVVVTHPSLDPAVLAQRRGQRAFLLLLLLPVVLFLGFIALFRSRFERIEVTTAAMEPTLGRGERFLAARLRFTPEMAPQRLEIVLVDPLPGESGPVPLRVIGLPGETIEIRPARLRIAGKPIAAHVPAPLWLRGQLHLPDRQALRLGQESVRIGNEAVPVAELARRLAVEASALSLAPGRVLINGATLEEPYLLEDVGFALGPRRLGREEVFVLGDNRNGPDDGRRRGAVPLSRLRGRVLPRATP